MGLLLSPCAQAAEREIHSGNNITLDSVPRYLSNSLQVMPANYVPVDPTDTNPALQQRMPIRDILKWVCKTALTVVGISIYLTTVVFSDGYLLTISSWVIRYVTVPALICNWI
jgi:hypothetical protein